MPLVPFQNRTILYGKHFRTLAPREKLSNQNPEQFQIISVIVELIYKLAFLWLQNNLPTIWCTCKLFYYNLAYLPQPV